LSRTEPRRRRPPAGAPLLARRRQILAQHRVDRLLDRLPPVRQRHELLGVVEELRLPDELAEKALPLCGTPVFGDFDQNTVQPLRETGVASPEGTPGG
jgi:hypothetical protein